MKALEEMVEEHGKLYAFLAMCMRMSVYGTAAVLALVVRVSQLNFNEYIYEWSLSDLVYLFGLVNNVAGLADSTQRRITAILRYISPFNVGFADAWKRDLVFSLSRSRRFGKIWAVAFMLNLEPEQIITLLNQRARLLAPRMYAQQAAQQADQGVRLRRRARSA